MIPDWLGWVLVGSSSFPLENQVRTSLIWSGLWIYVVLFLTYVAMRRMVRRWDLKDYRSLTGKNPTVDWTTNDGSSEAV